jgi:uncharacterized protein GlcG (DUF336 family)
VRLPSLLRSADTARSEARCRPGRLLRQHPTAGALWAEHRQRGHQQGARCRRSRGKEEQRAVAIAVVDTAGKLVGFTRFDNITPLEGGVPIVVDGKIIGAIGVSGVLSSQDAECVVAGAAAAGK